MTARLPSMAPWTIIVATAYALTACTQSQPPHHGQASNEGAVPLITCAHDGGCGPRKGAPNTTQPER
jgi:hypothetical protein